MPAVARIFDGYLVLEAGCTDRECFNGYIPGLQIPGELVRLLVKQGEHPILSPVFLGKMTDRFAVSEEHRAQEHNVPIIHFNKGQRKDDIAPGTASNSVTKKEWSKSKLAREKTQPSRQRIVSRVPSSNCYPITLYGRTAAIYFTNFHARIFSPPFVMFQQTHQNEAPSPLGKSLVRVDREIDSLGK